MRTGAVILLFTGEDETFALFPQMHFLQPEGAFACPGVAMLRVSIPVAEAHSVSAIGIDMQGKWNPVAPERGGEIKGMIIGII